MWYFRFAASTVVRTENDVTLGPKSPAFDINVFVNDGLGAYCVP